MIYKVLIFLLIFSVEVIYAETIFSSKDIDKINGVQIFVLDKEYEKDLDGFFKKLSEKGINTVFFRAFHNEKDRPHLNATLNCSSGVYFKTDHACVVNDMLPKIIHYGHKYNMKVYGWMATRSLSFLKTEDNMSLSLNPNGGNSIGYGANIFKENVRNSILNLFRDLAKTNVDGILFQDDFILKYNEGSDKFASELFEKETGISVKQENFFGNIKQYNNKLVFSKYTDLFYLWASWKTIHLANLFKEIKFAVKSINPKIKIAANVYYETPMDDKAAVSWYSQNLNVLKKAGADYYAIMGYVEQIQSEKKLDFYEALQYIGRIVKNAIKVMEKDKGVIIKLQSKSFKDGSHLSKIEYHQLCNEIKKNGNVSFVVVPVNKLEDVYTCNDILIDLDRDVEFNNAEVLIPEN